MNSSYYAIPDGRTAERWAERVGDGPGEMKGAAGGEHDGDTARGGLGDGTSVRIGQSSRRIEESAVDVDCEQADA